MVVVRILLSLILSLHCVSALSQVSDTRQGCIAGSFRTLQVQPAINPFAPPVINLADPSDRIVISFDELSDERRYLRYSLVHCDAEWRPEGLVDSEFLDSFNEGTIDDADFSQATVVHYVHYSFEIPNEQIRITQPGNYLVRVYDERDPDETLVQARFGVCDFTTEVRAETSSRTDIDTNGSHQQLGVRVDTRHSRVDNPFSELKIVITQNGRSDNEVILTTPQRVIGTEAVYEHLRPMIFAAGNEYRRFETSTVNYPGLRVEYVDHDAPVYNATLYIDSPRSGKIYQYDSTQQGHFFIRTADADDWDTQADYVLVHFTLSMPEIIGSDVFIEGDLTERQFTPRSRMTYDYGSGAYRQSLLLKQGAYNYQYLAVPAGSGDNPKGLTSPIEGDMFQTVNEYTVKVYHRPIGSRFDRLTGVTVVRAGV